MFEKNKYVTCKRENLHVDVIFDIYTLMLKSKSEKVWKLENLKIRLKLTH